MEKQFNAEREKLLANNTSVESELKTVTEDLTNQLTVAKSEVSQVSEFYFTCFTECYNISFNKSLSSNSSIISFMLCRRMSYLIAYSF